MSPSHVANEPREDRREENLGDIAATIGPWMWVNTNVLSEIGLIDHMIVASKTLTSATSLTEVI